MKNRTKLISAILLVALVSCAVTYAIIQYTVNVPCTVNVAVTHELELWNEEKTGVVSSFDFGSVGTGENAYSTIVWVKNVGNVPAWIGWECTDVPVGFSLICEMTDVSPWFPLEQLNYLTFSTNDGIASGAWSLYRLRWTLTNNAAGAGDYSFTISLHAADSSTG